MISAALAGLLKAVVFGLAIGTVVIVAVGVFLKMALKG